MRCVNEDFFNEDYFTLLDVAFKLSDFFEFTIKEESIKVNADNVLNENLLEETYSTVLEPLDEFLIKRKVHRYGNIAHMYGSERKSHVFRYKSIRRAKEVLKTFTNHAFGWEMGELPEYLAFYSNDKPLFVIVEDEAEIWFYDESEAELIPTLIERLST